MRESSIKLLIIILVPLLLMIGCGNYEEFKEDISGGFTGLAPNQELSWEVVRNDIFEARCTTCHSQYGTYENVKSNINAITALIRTNQMPKGAPLTTTQKELLSAWVNAGMPQQNPAPVPGPVPPQDRLTFSNLTQKVFKPHCISCHSNFSDYITIKNKVNSIVNMVRRDAMPIGSPLSSELKALLFEWAAAGAPQDSTGPIPAPPPAPSPRPLPLRPTYQSLNQHIFAKKCIACHNPSGRASFLDLSTYEAISRNSSRLFDFRRPGRSDIIDEITDNDEPMPPLNSSFERVTRNEITALIQWIQQRIPNN